MFVSFLFSIFIIFVIFVIFVIGGKCLEMTHIFDFFAFEFLNLPLLLWSLTRPFSPQTMYRMVRSRHASDDFFERVTSIDTMALSMPSAAVERAVEVSSLSL